MYDPYKFKVGGFSENDGTIDFYLRVNHLVNETSTVLDFGAGRAAWFEDDHCHIRKQIQILQGKVDQVIAADIDPIVLHNRASDKQIVVKDNKIDLPDHSVDVIIADYVLEHLDDIEHFYAEVARLLKPGGWLCARTPHKFCYVSLIAMVVKNRYHTDILRWAQPSRKSQDVFPTHFNLNTSSKIKTTFKGWQNKSFIFRSDPDYFFGLKALYYLQFWLHKILPKVLVGNLFVFVRKPENY